MNIQKRHKQNRDSGQSEANSALPSINDLVCFPLEKRRCVSVSSSSKFGDLVWDLSEFDKSTARHELLLNFQFISIQPIARSTIIDSAQCFAFSLLVDPPHPRIGIASVVKSFKVGGIKNLLDFMVKRNIFAFSDITKHDFEDFLAHERCRPLLNGNPISNRTLISRVREIDWLYQQSDKLTDALTFDPWQLHESYSKWASVSAETIVERGILRTEVIPDNVAKDLISIVMYLIAESPRLRKVLQAKCIYDATRHRDPFPTASFGFKDYFAVTTFYCHIRTATAILIGLLTGMRPREILSIPADPREACVEEEIEMNGTCLKCSFVTSILSKNVPTPQHRTWQTVPIVIEAIRSLAELNGLFSITASPWLFRSPRLRRRQGHDHDERRLPAINLSVGMTKLRASYGSNTEEWTGSLSGNSLRRTFSRMLTRNGLGLLELQDQLKHFDPDITRMYGQPSLTLHMHEEKISLSEDVYQELLAGVTPIIGGGAQSFRSMRKDYQGLTRPDQIKFIKDLSDKALIDQVDIGLCTYRPEKALCGGNKMNCKPDVCMNSIIPIESAIKSLDNRKRENERLLRLIPRSRELQRLHLISQLKIINNLLSQAAE